MAEREVARDFVLAPPSMSLPRAIVPGVTYLLTRRVPRWHLLLRPDPVIAQILGWRRGRKSGAVGHGLVRAQGGANRAAPPQGRLDVESVRAAGTLNVHPHGQEHLPERRPWSRGGSSPRRSVTPARRGRGRLGGRGAAGKEDDVPANASEDLGWPPGFFPSVRRRAPGDVDVGAAFAASSRRRRIARCGRAAMKYMVDTDAYIRVLRGRPASVANRLKSVPVRGRCPVHRGARRVPPDTPPGLAARPCSALRSRRHAANRVRSAPGSSGQDDRRRHQVREQEGHVAPHRRREHPRRERPRHRPAAEHPLQPAGCSTSTSRASGLSVGSTSTGSLTGRPAGATGTPSTASAALTATCRTG
jgi:hypothetical protein